MLRKKFRIPRKKIAEFCKRWSILEFSIFGSVLRDDFRPDSDTICSPRFAKQIVRAGASVANRVLVSIDPKVQIRVVEMAKIQIELENIFKHPVDLVEKERLRYPYRRGEILRTAQLIYSAS
jgi:predicted nucleotidyltransferase